MPINAELILSELVGPLIALTRPDLLACGECFFPEVSGDETAATIAAANFWESGVYCGNLTILPLLPFEDTLLLACGETVLRGTLLTGERRLFGACKGGENALLFVGGVGLLWWSDGIELATT